MVFISQLVNVCLTLIIICYYSTTKFIVNKGITNISCRCLAVEKPLCLCDGLSFSWMQRYCVIEWRDDRLQDEICDLYALWRHFQSVWITLKEESITSSWRGSGSLSWLKFFSLSPAVSLHASESQEPIIFIPRVMLQLFIWVLVRDRTEHIRDYPQSDGLKRVDYTSPLSYFII